MPRQAPTAGGAACALTSTLRGRAAEQLAARFLEARGLAVIARNFRCRRGELDLVCLDAGVLAIVEVRQRRRGDYGGALGSVTARKQQRIMHAAGWFLLRHRCWRAYPARFDVVALQGAPGGAQQIIWIKDAFRAG
jgi:putative endonuclease